jgi:hypothetical protein
MNTYQSAKISPPQLVWDHGYETFNKDGTTTQISRLRTLRGSLPRGMFAKMTTVWGKGSREVSVEVTIQARAPGGRRHNSYYTLEQAYAATFKWANRILRERANEPANSTSRGSRQINI